MEFEITGIADEVASLEATEGELTELFLERVKRLVVKRARPDNIRISDSVHGIVRLIAVKKLKHKYRDGMGEETNEDLVLVKQKLIGEEFSEEEIQQALNSEYYFFNDSITPEEHEKLLEEIQKYISVDVEDKKVPRILALIPLGMKAESPSKKWNEVAQKFIKSRDEDIDSKRIKTIVEVESIVREFGEDLNEFDINIQVGAASDDEIEIRARDSVTLEEIARKVIKVSETAIDEARRFIQQVIEQERQKLRENLLSTKIYSFEVKHEIKDGIVFVYVPKEKAGMAIGSNGRNVKRMQRILGMRIKIIPV